MNTLSIIFLILLIAFSIYFLVLFKKKTTLKNTLNQVERLQESLSILSKKRETMLKEEETEKERIKESITKELHESANRLAKLQAENIYEAKTAFERITSTLKQEIALEETKLNTVKEQISSERNRYQAIVSAIEEEEVRRTKNRIVIGINEIEDIQILVEKVLPFLKNKEPLQKLIWVSYIQKPTNLMLDRILLNTDPSGIYKITDVETGRSYIGKSVNVRNRLQEHIKSSLGVGTIADQIIHQVMAEKGVWNFSFELLETAPKELLSEREKYYISFYKTNGPAGFNQNAGG